MGIPAAVVVSEQEWTVAREALLVKEKAQTHHALRSPAAVARRSRGR